MGRPTKPLTQHLAEGTFRPSEHAHRITTEPLPRHLEHFRERYRNARSERERQAIALELRDAAAERQARQLPLAGLIYASLGPDPGDAERLGFRRADGTIDWSRFEALERRWRHWNGRAGTPWRWKHRCPHNQDLLKLVRLLTGERLKRVDVARKRLAALEEELEALVAGKEPLRDPPGLELVLRT
jgi:hypothetical protein